MQNYMHAESLGRTPLFSGVASFCLFVLQLDDDGRHLLDGGKVRVVHRLLLENSRASRVPKIFGVLTLAPKANSRSERPQEGSRLQALI